MPDARPRVPFPVALGPTGVELDFRRDAESGLPLVCPAYLQLDDIAPFDSLEFQSVIPLPDIVGDSLPEEGPYWFVAEPTFENLGTARLAAGQAFLTRDQAALPSERVIGGLAFRARTETIGDDPVTVRTEITIENMSREPIASSIPADCPVRVYVYRDRERRDRAFCSGEPDAGTTSLCVLHPLRFTLAPGESRAFDTVLTGPVILGGSLPEGRYFLLAVTWANDGGDRVVLAAGEADLRR